MYDIDINKLKIYPKFNGVIAFNMAVDDPPVKIIQQRDYLFLIRTTELTTKDSLATVKCDGLNLSIARAANFLYWSK